MNFEKQLGNRIKQLRIKNKIDQIELANLLGYKAFSTISKWENGETTPPIQKIIELATILNTSTDYLLFGKNNTEIINNNKNNFKGNYSGNINITNNNHHNKIPTTIKNLDDMYKIHTDNNTLNKEDFKLQSDMVYTLEKLLSTTTQILHELKKLNTK